MGAYVDLLFPMLMCRRDRSGCLRVVDRHPSPCSRRDGQGALDGQKAKAPCLPGEDEAEHCGEEPEQCEQQQVAEVEAEATRVVEADVTQRDDGHDQHLRGECSAEGESRRWWRRGSRHRRVFCRCLRLRAERISRTAAWTARSCPAHTAGTGHVRGHCP